MPDPDSATQFNSLGGLPPADQLASASGEYDVVDATTGKTVGYFDGVSSRDLDTFGLNNQEILVQHDIGGSDVPPEESFFDTSSAFGFQNVYSDVNGYGSPNTITDTLTTPFGTFNVPTTFDATAALNPATFTDPSTTAGYNFLPTTGEALSIGGMPIQDQTVSGGRPTP